MTSVLNVDTIADKAGTGPVALTKQTAAKAFCAYEMYDSNTIRGSFNVSSQTDNNTGVSEISWINSMQDGYVAGGASSDQLNLSINGGRSVSYNTNLATGSAIFATTSDAGTALDSNKNLIAVHGDLA